MALGKTFMSTQKSEAVLISASTQRSIPNASHFNVGPETLKALKDEMGRNTFQDIDTIKDFKQDYN